MSGTVNIYGLVDPRTGLISYIGKTKDTIDKRLRSHVNSANSKKDFSARKKWILDMVLNGLSPSIELIDSVPNNEWAFWERHYIKLFKSFGAKLYNSTEGGDLSVEMSKEARDKLSKSKMKRTGFITQYDLNGNFIKEWKAADVPIKKSCNIVRSCRNIDKTAYGFFWRFGSKKKNGETVSSYKKKQHVLSKKIIQLSLNGDKIAEHKSISSAAKKLKINSRVISRVCNGGRKSTNGFIWKFKK